MNQTKRTLQILKIIIASPKNPPGVRKMFEQLGSTFVKLGQVLSTRPDLIPDRYAQEFRQLLDHQNPLSYSRIKTVLEQNIQQSIFKSIEPQPLASASIAQVHRAILKTGKSVVIKIKRPGIDDLIKNDLKILKKLAILINYLKFARGIDAEIVIEEFKRWISRELDFNNEIQNIIKFQKNLSQFKYIKIPHVYEQYSNQQIIVMEYIDGITINQILNLMQQQHKANIYEVTTPFKINYELIVKRTIDLYLHMILKDRFFHADPHPANLIITKNNNIGLVDFGIVEVVDKKEYALFLTFLISIIENDPEAYLKAILSASRKKLSQSEQEQLIRDITLDLHDLHDVSLANGNVGNLFTTLISIGRKYQIPWSPGFLLAVKSITMLDGLGVKCGLTKSFVDFIKPHVDKYLPEITLNQYSKLEFYQTIMKLIKLGKEIPDDYDRLRESISEHGLKIDNQS